MSKMDKLFKDKLEGHSLQPSAQAWEKVEAHLGKKNRMVLWARVAAAVAVLGVLTFVGINWNDGSQKTREVASKEQGVRSKEQGVRSKESVKEKPGVTKKKSGVRSKKPGVGTKKHEVTPKNQSPEPGTLNPALSTQNPEPVEQIAVVPEPEVIPEIQNPEHRTSNIELRTQKGITLTYSLPSIKKEVAEPLVAETKKTGLERVLEIAREVKNGDNPLGELREAKNDILALEFRKDKDKKKQ